MSSPNKDERIVVVGAFCPSLSLWNTLLDQVIQTEVSVTQSELRRRLNTFHFQFEVSGEWHQLAKFETQLKAEQNKLADGTVLHYHRALLKAEETLYIPYYAEVTSIFNVDLIVLLSQFFDAERILLQEMSVDRFVEGRTFVPLQTIRVKVWIPIDIHLPELRESFMLFCEQYNVDGIFEPDRR
jgi:glycine cleavage system transcriptional repressor